ncbi:hypothetical protein LVJ82_15400 [Vitreoscilla massiliensis]|uniref:Uncharacterized protein n=1 Tax=Vitreoscilla massiliensis TaxID=1689272 RepID=A0ABY4DZ74_9NEIS|nr:hypothetical protein [Vitreoscilla massiliensis]UOO88824.1 hypothetical protein LVJ82_15400 [Vitreoscilla massiliensis]
MDFEAALTLLLQDFAQASSQQKTIALQVLADFLPLSSPQQPPCSQAVLHALLDAAISCFVTEQDNDIQEALATLIRNASVYVGVLPRQDARLCAWLQAQQDDVWHGYFS